MEDTTRGRFQRWLLFWALLALALRLGNLALNDPPTGDDNAYITIARSLLNGTGFQDNGVWAYRYPAYVGFLTGMFALFGPVRGPVIAVQALFGAVTVLVLGYVVRRRLGDVAALFVAAAFTLYVPFIRLPGRLYTENALFLLLACAWWLLERPGGRLRHTDAVGAGVLVGLGALTREVFIPMAAAYALLRLLAGRRWKEDMIPLCVMLVCAAVVVAPWTYRNYLLFHRFVLVTTNRWMNVYMGYNPLADGFYTGDKDLPVNWDKLPDKSEWKSDHMETELADRAEAAAKRYIRENPGRAAQLALLKLGYAWGPPSLIQVDVTSSAEKAAIGAWTVMYFVLLLLALYGFLRGPLSLAEFAWPYSLAVLGTSSMVATYVITRYRFPIDLALIVFAANGYIAMLSRITRPSSGTELRPGN